MAKSVGIPPFVGTIGILTSYKNGDQYTIKRKSEVSEYRLKNGYEFRNFRKAQKGFGGGGHVARALMRAWLKNAQYETDGKVFPRLNGQLFLAQRQGPGQDRAKHEIQLAENAQHMIGFPLSQDRLLTDRINHEPIWTYTPETGNISLWMPPNTHVRKETAPAIATHLTLRLTVALISDYHYDEKNQIYAPKEAKNHESIGHLETAPIEIGPKGADISDLLLEMELPWEKLPHQNLVLTFGIMYYNYNSTTETPRILRHEGKRRKRETEGASKIIGIIKTTQERTEEDNKAHPAPPKEKYPYPVWQPGMPEKIVNTSGSSTWTQQYKNKTIHDRNST